MKIKTTWWQKALILQLFTIIDWASTSIKWLKTPYAYLTEGSKIFWYVYQHLTVNLQTAALISFMFSIILNFALLGIFYLLQKVLKPSEKFFYASLLFVVLLCSTLHFYGALSWWIIYRG